VDNFDGAGGSGCAVNNYSRLAHLPKVNLKKGIHLMQRIKVSFDTWIQLVGMLGVLGGLVFVGLEMRQSQQIAIGGQVQARNEAFLNLYLSMLGEDSTGRSLTASGYLAALRDPTELSEDEYDVWYTIKSWQVMSLQNAYQQYEMGLLPKSVWEQVDSRIQEQYSDCYIRPIWRTAATPSMRAYLSTLSLDCAIGQAEGLKR
jgi:hypothetical protein